MVSIIATKPLTEDEDWIEMEKGELLLFVKGVVYKGEDEDEGEVEKRNVKCKKKCRSGEDEREGSDRIVKDVNSESHDNLTLLGTPTRPKSRCPFKNCK